MLNMIDTDELIHGQYITKFGFIKAGYGSYELSKALNHEDTNEYIMFIVSMSRAIKRLMK